MSESAQRLEEVAPSSPEELPAGARRHRLVSADGVDLHLLELRGDPGPAVLLLPGFFRRAESDTHLMMGKRFADRVATYHLDFRGHGESEGEFTFGRKEVADVEAALGFLRAAGHGPLSIVGLSMGGYLAVRTLGERPEAWPEVRSLAVISAPSRWAGVWPRLDLRLPFQARVPRADVVCPPRVRVGDLFGPRVEALEVVQDLAVPLQVHHHEGDWLIRYHLGVELFEAAPAPKEFHRYGDDLRVDHADHLVRNHFEEIMGHLERWSGF